VSDTVLLVDAVAHDDSIVVRVTLVVKLFSFAVAETEREAVCVMDSTGVLDLHAVADWVTMSGVTEEFRVGEIVLVEQSVGDDDGEAEAHAVVEKLPEVDGVSVWKGDQDTEYVGVIVDVTDPVSLCRLDLELVSDREMVFECVVEIVALEELQSLVVGDVVALDDAECDRDGDADGVSVAVWHAEAESEYVGAPEEVAVIDMHPDELAEELLVTVGEPLEHWEVDIVIVCETVGDGDSEEVSQAVIVAESELLTVTDTEDVALEVADGQEVTLWVAELHADTDGEIVAVFVAVESVDNVPESVADWLPEMETVANAVAENNIGVLDSHPDTDPDAVSIVVTECDCDAKCVIEGVAVSLTEPVSDELPETDPVDDGVDDNEGELDPHPDADCDDVTEFVAQCDGVAEAESERYEEDECVTESVALYVVHGLAVDDAKVLLESVTDAVTDDDELYVADGSALFETNGVGETETDERLLLDENGCDTVGVGVTLSQDDVVCDRVFVLDTVIVALTDAVRHAVGDAEPQLLDTDDLVTVIVPVALEEEHTVSVVEAVTVEHAELELEVEGEDVADGHCDVVAVIEAELEEDGHEVVDVVREYEGFEVADLVEFTVAETLEMPVREAHTVTVAE
jgi:hypothetical protein